MDPTSPAIPAPAHRDRVTINTGTWGVWLLGDHWKQRVRILRCLGGGLVYLLVCLLMNWVARHGYLPAEPVLAISAAIGLTTVVFYAMLRSNMNLRFRDASLTMPQMVMAVTYAAWIYAMGGPARDVMLFILAPLLLYGFRYLRPL